MTSPDSLAWSTAILTLCGVSVQTTTINIHGEGDAALQTIHYYTLLDNLLSLDCSRGQPDDRGLVLPAIAGQTQQALQLL